MSIPGKQTINIGLPNESINSDSLYTAFNKADSNFDTLFSCSSPYTNFVGGAGITVVPDANTGTVSFTNTGVTNIIAGTNIVLDHANGNVTISSLGAGGGAGVTSIGLTSSPRLTVTNSPVVSSGNINIDLAASGVTSGAYHNPTLNIDAYGRITSASNGTVTGTVTSVGLVPGEGIQVSGGPVTSSGVINVTNTGVTRINPGTGISVSSGNGNVTISAVTAGGTVTSVGVTSSQLVVSGGPIVESGSINIELPANATFTGNVAALGLKTDNLYHANGVAWTVQQAAGSNNEIQFNTSDNFQASANLTFNPSTNILRTIGNIQADNINAGNLLTANYAATVLTTAAQPNITSVSTSGGSFTVGTVANGGFHARQTEIIVNSASASTEGAQLVLAYKGVTGLTSSGNSTWNVDVDGSNNFRIFSVSSSGVASVPILINSSASNTSVRGNIVLETGRLIYTPQYGSFYSDTTQDNTVANTARAVTLNNTRFSNDVNLALGSRIVFPSTGLFAIQFDAQVDKTSGGGTGQFEMWLSKNGVSVPWSRSIETVSTNGPILLTRTFIENVTSANTYYEIMWYSSSSEVQLLSLPSVNGRPAIPSAVITVHPVGA